MPNDDGPFKKNALFIAGGVGYTILGLICGIFLTESNRADLNDLAAVSSLSDAPTPCGFATPSLATLMTDLNFEAYPVLSGYRGPDAQYESTVLRGLCTEPTVHGAVARLWGEQPEQVATPLLFLSHLCHRAHVRETPWYLLTDDNLQDPASRVRRAYVRAQPAFAHYFANRESGNCDWMQDPFGDDDDSSCKTGLGFDEISKQLQYAALPERVCGLSEDSLPNAGSVPEDVHMVYRLLALAVLAESDRAHNNGKCFKNIGADGVPQSAIDLCNGAVGECADGWTANAATFPAPTYPWQERTFPANIHTYTDSDGNTRDLLCTAVYKDATETDFYPEETLRPAYELDEKNDDGTDRFDPAGTGAAREHCYRTHEYSSRSSEFLFGLPDIESAPSPHPVGSIGGPGKVFVDIFYVPWFADVRNRAFAELKSSALRDGIAYEGFRFGLALFLRVPGLYSAGFWAGRGIALCLGTLLPAFRKIIKPSYEVPSVEKPGSWAFTTILAVVVGLWTALFARFIDPLAIPEASKTTCTEYATSGRVFDSSLVDALRDYFSSIFLMLISLFAIVWELFLRKQKLPAFTPDQQQQKKWKNKRGISGILLLLVLFLLLLEVIICAQVAIDSGFNLQENVLFTGGAGVRDVNLDVQTLNNDIYFLQAVAISHSAVIGLFTTLFAVAGTISKGKYFGLGLWLAAIFAALLIGLSRFAHLPPESYVPVNRGLRDFCIALTLITDGALAAYAFFVACSRYRVQSFTEKVDNAKKEAAALAAGPKKPGFLQRRYNAFKASAEKAYDGVNRASNFAGKVADLVSSEQAIGQYDHLPLLALRPER